MRRALALLVLAMTVASGCEEKTAPAAGSQGAAQGTGRESDRTQGETRAPAGVPAPGAAVVATTLRIAVVPKGTTHDFWKSVHAGAVKAERELGDVQVTFRGPEKEDDREQQMTLVQNIVSAEYDAIVLAPLDDRALVGPVRDATAAGVPVVIIDSDLRGEAGKDFVSFVATDNERGGQLAGERMIELLGGKGKVLVLRYMEGSASTALREKGFIDSITKAAGIAVVDPGRYAGATRATAQEAAENLLSVSDDCQGVFCPNESSTFGMLLALRSRGLAGKVRFIGFDSSEELVDGLAKADIDALVVQNPIRMGYLGVKTAVEYLRKTTVETRIDTGVALITRENMGSIEASEVLSPDLSPYLGSN